MKNSKDQSQETERKQKERRGDHGDALQAAKVEIIRRMKDDQAEKYRLYLEGRGRKDRFERIK